MEKKIYVLPPAFYSDHRARDLPEVGSSDVVKASSRKVHVLMDIDAYLDLLSDSRHYGWSMRQAGFDDIGLIGSARATYRALDAAGPPEEIKSTYPAQMTEAEDREQYGPVENLF